jgi:sugar lactone lactonase YvrE
MRTLLLALVLITATVGAMLASASARELTGELRRDRTEAADGREGGQAPAPPKPAAPPRGASGPPEHAKVAPINNLPNPYETVRNWGTLPEGRKWGSVSAVHVDVDGKHIWAGDRCGANACIGSTIDPIVKLDPNGKVVQSFGAGLIAWPHGMDVDRQGNIWIADARAATAAELAKFPDWKNKGHAVLKFSPQGKLLMTLGTPGEAGDPPAKFTEPNDVLVAPDGSIFVAETHNAQFLDQNPPDGIGRISKFDRDGKFLKSFGSYGYGPSQFRGPHSLAMDSKGRLFVADRGNRRILIFDQDGKQLDTWYQFSRISGLYIDRNDTLYAIDSESDDNYNPGWRKGLRVGSARTGEVWYFVPEHVSKQPTGMGGIGAMGEGVAVDAQGNVYGGEVGPVQGLTKFVPRLKR